MLSALIVSTAAAQQDEEVIVGTVKHIQSGYIQEPIPYHPATPGIVIGTLTFMAMSGTTVGKVIASVGASLVGGAMVNKIAKDAYKKDAYEVTIETGPDEQITVLQSKIKDIMIGDPVSVVGYDTDNVKISRLNF